MESRMLNYYMGDGFGELYLNSRFMWGPEVATALKEHVYRACYTPVRNPTPFVVTEGP